MSIGVSTHPVDPHARADARRHRRIAIAHRSGWIELPRRHLRLGRFGVVMDERSDDSYLVSRAEIDAEFSPIVAYYIDPAGDPVFLEKRTR